MIRIGLFKIRAERVNVQASAAGIAGIHSQLVRLAMREDVAKNALNALLMKFVMLPEADEIF